ncbi:MAG: CotH kinase family protein [Flavobacterium sp.]|nr:CotH kinase family protein [Flavobacterium sp.]
MNKTNLFKLSIFSLILLFIINVKAQTFTNSNLPIVVITTDLDPNTNQPYSIPDSPTVLGNIKIIKHTDGSRNYLTDINTATYLNCNSRLSIQIRGSSSQVSPKKGYGFTTLLANNTDNNNISLLGMPSENDWILNGLAFDPSLIRDYLAYNLSRQMGNYATRTQYCEVVINDEYMGLYLLQEKIKSDSNRVNVLKIASTDITIPNLTGGYITKADKTTGSYPVAWTNYPYAGYAVNYIHDLPKPINVTSEQDAYIQTQFNDLTTSASSNNSSLLNGYTNTIDVPSFVDFMVSNEFGANVDGYQLSTYFHKDRNGKLRAGPIWDFNLTLGNDLFFWGFNRSFYNVWQFSNGDNEGSKFWTDLFNNAEFKCYFAKRFHDLTQAGQPMNENVLNSYIDNTLLLISEAMVREHNKWATVPNNAQEIAGLKLFIQNRIIWMTDNLESYAACSNVATPPLVISQINYNPASIANPTTVSSNDQEFIQITNTGSTSLNLSGIYFSQLGLTFQFPYNSSISGNSSLYLSANAAVFQSQNSFAPFGQYTRNLSNKSQNIVLADAFGNIIDQVNYSDSAPWPTAADGSGSYLQLISTTLDNNLASSWVASFSNLANDYYNLNNASITIYPNPANHLVSITSSTAINKIEIIDVYGKLLKSENISSKDYTTDISSFSNGIYLLKIYNESGIQTNKLIKR